MADTKKPLSKASQTLCWGHDANYCQHHFNICFIIGMKMMNMMNIHKSQLCFRVLIHSLPSKIAIWRSPRNRVAQRETPLEKNLREVVGRCTAWGWQKKGGFVGKSWEIFHLPRDLAGTSSSKIDIKYSTYSGIRDPTGSFSASDLS